MKENLFCFVKQNVFVFDCCDCFSYLQKQFKVGSILSRFIYQLSGNVYELRNTVLINFYIGIFYINYILYIVQ